jgi:hypothetical protein
MEVFLSLIILVTLPVLILMLISGDAMENRWPLFLSIFAFLLISLGNLISYGLAIKTDYICPTFLSENISVYYNGSETIIIPPQYNPNELVIQKSYSGKWGSIMQDAYELVYDINGVCK